MTQKTVLLVEDSDLETLIIENIFQTEFPNVKFISASTAEDGIAVLQSVPIDLVLLDLILHDGRNGLELVKYALAQQPGPAIIVMTADSSQKTEDLVNSHGVDTFMTKPFTYDVLVSVVKAFLIKY